MRGQKERGGWGPWRDLKGREVEGELAAVTRESGLVELYAASPAGILRWTQAGPGHIPALDEEPLKVAARPGTLRALSTSDEHVTLFFTDETDTVCAWRAGSEPVALLTCAGPGPVSAIRCTLDGVDCTLLAQRSLSGRIAFAAYPTEQESAGAWWTESGPQLPADVQLSLGQDHEGRVTAATLQPDHRPTPTDPPQGGAGPGLGGLAHHLARPRRPYPSRPLGLRLRPRGVGCRVEVGCGWPRSSPRP